jgi:pimeloyl-ACP methyl ester carboxylesterase
VARFVLVHGGGHGGWCYGKVARLLRAEGHEVHAPSLTGLGDRSHLLRPGIDLDVHITDIVNLLFYEDMRDVILAGHSYGGMVITGVADRAPDRVGHLVFLDAAMPRDGESLAELSPVLIGEARRQSRVVDGVELVLFPGSDSVRHYGVTDEEDAAWMQPRLTPHPYACFDQKLRLTNEEALARIPRTIINCKATIALRPEENRGRALEGERVWEIDTGHDLMISEPERTAAMLSRVAAL